MQQPSIRKFTLKLFLAPLGRRILLSLLIKKDSVLMLWYYYAHISKIVYHLGKNGSGVGVTWDYNCYFWCLLYLVLSIIFLLRTWSGNVRLHPIYSLPCQLSSIIFDLPFSSLWLGKTKIVMILYEPSGSCLAACWS